MAEIITKPDNVSRIGNRLFMVGMASASPVDQYATSVTGYGSQWGSSRWSAVQALGVPDTSAYGDFYTAWTPSPENGSKEYLTLGFETAVYADGTVIRKTYGNGFVYQIDLIDVNDTYHTVWSGIDPSTPGTSVDFISTWETTNYLVDGIKIYVNTNNNMATWKKINSVQLLGSNAVSIPGAVWLLGLGLAGFVGL